MKIIKYKIFQLIISLLLYVTLSTGMAETELSGDERDVDYNGSDCIWIRSIRDYKALDERTLLIWGGPRPYLVRLLSANREMRSAFGMSVDSRDDRLCPYGGDGLVFGSFDPRPVRVRSISRLSKGQLDQILVRYGQSESSEPQTPAPREVEGADVEELD